MKYDIKERYEYWCKNSKDIKKHLPLLKNLSLECDHITEFGVRYVVSTWAFLMGNPKKLVSVDINSPEKFNVSVNDIKQTAKENNIEFVFIQSNDLDIEIEETDLLFIDTLHTYNQLSQELKLHNGKVKKYIVMHDTDTYGRKGQCGEEGLLKAINEFLENNNIWFVYKKEKGDHGLTILKKKNIS